MRSKSNEYEKGLFLFVFSILFIRIIIIIIMWLLMNHYKGSRIISLQIWEEDYINNIQYPNIDFAYVCWNLLRLDAAAKIHHIKSVQVVRHLFIHGQRVTYCLFPNWVGDRSYKYLSHSNLQNSSFASFLLILSNQEYNDIYSTSYC